MLTPRTSWAPRVLAVAAYVVRKDEIVVIRWDYFLVTDSISSTSTRIILVIPLQLIRALSSGSITFICADSASGSGPKISVSLR